MKKSERSSYTTLDFQGWNEINTLVLTPKFQRRGVWTRGARSYFIDTLLRGMPVPPIFLRVRQSDDKKKIVREVVDGQQRLSAVLKYIADDYKLSKSLDKRWAGKKFSELDGDFKDEIRQASFICEVFQGVSDSDILEVFARLNTYAVPLNSQELRNGKYFGFFKQSAYRLAYAYVDFWRKHGIFSDRAVARMQEVELTSEMLIAEIDGLQDKKKSIDKFYLTYDEEFAEQKRCESRFSSTIDAIEAALGDVLEDTEFVRPPLFYTLFCAVFHKTHGLPKFNAKTSGKPLTASDGHDLADALTKLSEIIAKARDDEDIPSSYTKFVTACLRSTDNIENRTTRLQVLYREAFS
jgi:uncharacterized protein with ParB-like and HNH nuclease domain